jgi:flavin-binding protein dodecin
MAKNNSEKNVVYKMLELTGTSSKSTDDAIQGAIARASQTVRNLRWFEVIDQRGAIEGGQVTEWQVTVKCGFRLEK